MMDYMSAHERRDGRGGVGFAALSEKIASKFPIFVAALPFTWVWRGAVAFDPCRPVDRERKLPGGELSA